MSALRLGTWDFVEQFFANTVHKPSGTKSWVEKLPQADAGSWAARSSRRKQRSVYRLAFVPSKFRVGEEPEPFILEVDLTDEAWTLRDVTDDVDQAGARARAESQRQRDELCSSSACAFAAEVTQTSVTRMAWSIAETSKSTGLSRGFLRKEIKKGALRARKLGRRVVILDGDLCRFLGSGAKQAA